MLKKADAKEDEVKARARTIKNPKAKGAPKRRLFRFMQVLLEGDESTRARLDDDDTLEEKDSRLEAQLEAILLPLVGTVLSPDTTSRASLIEHLDMCLEQLDKFHIGMGDARNFSTLAPMWQRLDARPSVVYECMDDLQFGNFVKLTAYRVASCILSLREFLERMRTTFQQEVEENGDTRHQIKGFFEHATDFPDPTLWTLLSMHNHETPLVGSFSFLLGSAGWTLVNQIHSKQELQQLDNEVPIGVDFWMHWDDCNEIYRNKGARRPTKR